jgi:hypothetical protein
MYGERTFKEKMMTKAEFSTGKAERHMKDL